MGAATGLVALAEYGAFTLPNWLILVLTILISTFHGLRLSAAGADRVPLSGKDRRKGPS